MLLKEGFSLFASCPADDESLEEAREYVRQNGLTKEEVKIVRTGYGILVKARKEINFG